MIMEARLVAYARGSEWVAGLSYRTAIVGAALDNRNQLVVS